MREGLGSLMSENTHDHGFDLLFHPSTNQSTAFTLEEHRWLSLRGLLPAQVSTMERQKERVLGNIRRNAYADELARLSRPDDLHEHILTQMNEPSFEDGTCAS